jgi:hypothetical protein
MDHYDSNSEFIKGKLNAVEHEAGNVSFNKIERGYRIARYVRLLKFGSLFVTGAALICVTAAQLGDRKHTLEENAEQRPTMPAQPVVQKTAPSAVRMNSINQALGSENDIKSNSPIYRVYMSGREGMNVPGLQPAFAFNRGILKAGFAQEVYGLNTKARKPGTMSPVLLNGGGGGKSWRGRPLFTAKALSQDEPVAEALLASQSLLVTSEENQERIDMIWPKYASTEEDLRKTWTLKSPLDPVFNMHRFYLRSEVLFNMVTYAVSANPNKGDAFAEDKDGRFAEDYTRARIDSRYSLLSGSALVGYCYKNMDVSAGVGFLNIETKINTREFSRQLKGYTIDQIIYDSLTGREIDTTYKEHVVKEYIIVNGDSVRPADYLNNLRVLTIPVHFGYSIPLWRRKMFVEPMAGVHIGIPLSSNQLVAVKPYEFEYSRNKLVTKPVLFYYSFAVSLRYKLSPSASVYLKQGVFFSDNSIYNDDYLVHYTIRNVYTSLGLAVYIR